MAMNRAKFRKQLQEGLNTTFGLEYRKWAEEWRQMFDVENSQKAYEEDQLVYGFGAAPQKPEGGSVSFDEGGEAWVARYVHETIALAFAITEEAEEDNLYGSLGAKYAKALARSMQHTKEVKGAGILNNGFDSNYPGGDGEPLFSTSHPLVSGGTLANRLSTPADLSETSLEDAMIRISQFVDDRGLQIMVKATKLIVPPAQSFVASRILYSPGRPGTADNDINVINQQDFLPNGHAVNHYLTDDQAWFLKTDVPDGLKHMVRKNVQRGVEGDFETGNMRYKARERYTFGFTDPRGAFGSAGGGT
jgi:hypothetical protein